MKKNAIVKAAIYPAIGIARVGNSEEEFFIGPERIAPEPRPAGFYKDATGALKRQAARFRVYGLDARGNVVEELDAGNAEITWHVHVANRKAEWFEFDTAMDVPQANPVVRRNANFTGASRAKLIIDPGQHSIAGKANETPVPLEGTFVETPVYLGELRTDEEGRLLFLGGRGVSASPFGNNPPTTFANNEGWYDDVSDGPVDATVTLDGAELPCEGAWVVTAPPNYAPDIIAIQTMYDVIVDTLSGLYIPPGGTPSFRKDIYPVLQRFSQNQWVNKGFYVSYGRNQSYDFDDPAFITKLATITKPGDAFGEYRLQIFNYFRPPNTTEIDPRLWPWMYGDNMGGATDTPNKYFWVTNTIYSNLRAWAEGNFLEDWDPDAGDDPATPQEEADTLTKAALHYCLGGPFHPGCELTWPMRLPPMYTGPFRIRRRTPNNPEPDYGDVLTPIQFQGQNYFNTVPDVCWNGPGDLTRWMASPWQTDTASCRAGYEPQYDVYIPTFWPARVPNTVLTERDYQIVIDKKRPREERLAAFNRRASWYRILGSQYLTQIANMIQMYGDLGVVEAREGVKDDPDLPPIIFVESVPKLPQVPATRLFAATAEAHPMTLEEVPDDQGLVVGAVGRIVRHRR